MTVSPKFLAQFQFADGSSDDGRAFGYLYARHVVDKSVFVNKLFECFSALSVVFVVLLAVSKKPFA